MGVLEQRFRSILIHTGLVVFILASISFAADEKNKKGAVALPAIKVTQAVSSKSQTESRLPPALEALLIGIVGSCNLDRPDAVEPIGFAPLTRYQQLLYFKTILAAIPETYGNLAPYSGPPIRSLNEFVQVVEPTRVHTGSLRPDLELLYSRISAGQVPKAATLSRENFADLATSVQAEIFLYERASQAHRLFSGAVGSGVLPPTVVASVLKGLVGVLMTSGGLESILRQFSSSVSTAPVETGASESDGKAKTKGLPSPKAPDGFLALTLTVPTAIAGLGTAASGTADLIKYYQSLARTEEGVLEMMRRLDGLDTGAQIDFLVQMQKQIQDVALPEIYRIGTRAANSPELAGVRDPKVKALIELFFSEYPRYLETDSIMDIVLDIMRSPLDTSDVKLAGILLRHFDPIAQEFFQTVSEIGDDDGEESMASEFDKTRDSGWTAPYAQIEKVIQDDPNDYPLENVSIEPLKAGKLFQIHTADWRNADGSLTPVVVRVLKPGIEHRLDRARIRLKQLAPRLSFALRDPKDGTGPSPRRVEQLVEMIYRNFKEEMRVDLTVENQNRAASRLSKEIEKSIRGQGKVKLQVKVPKAFAARPDSKVMVMERVSNPISLKNMKRYHPEVVDSFADLLLDLTLENSLVKPMQAALGLIPEMSEDGEDSRIGFMHGDPHSGNVLFNSDTVNLIDFGLVVLVEPEKVKEIVKLAAGASYNSAPFIMDAIWSLRDDSMNDFKPEVLAEAKTKLRQLIDRKVASLNRSGEFYSPADWVKYVWFREAVDLPDWVVLMEQGFRALTQSFLKLGKSQAQFDRRMVEFGDGNRDLIYKYLAKVAPRHAGWGPIYRSELGARLKSCSQLLWSRKDPEFAN